MSTELSSLVRGEHADPHRVLAPLSAKPGQWRIRTFHPRGVRAFYLPPRGRPRAMRAASVAGVFELTLRQKGRPRVAVRFEFEDGGTWDRIEPWGFAETVGEVDRYLFNEGRHLKLHEVLGARLLEHEGVAGTAFSVWAPNARAVSVTGDFCGWEPDIFPMRALHDSGVWEIFLPGVEQGSRYKFSILPRDGARLLKADPMAAAAEPPPATASVVWSSDYVRRHDDRRSALRSRDVYRNPLNTYEVHLGSWRRRPDGSFFNYRDIAEPLARHVQSLGFDSIELLPVAEHPFYGSWGYQVSGYFAPTARYGTPDDFRFFVDTMHRYGLRVLLDWVPAHFVKDDHALARFDGTALYEHEDPRKGLHPDWDTLIFNYGRAEVRGFLIANALYWLEEFAIDGLRVDAVASMLYLDYSREDGQWLPNDEGGNIHKEAASFLRELNEVVAREAPGCIVIAEESTAFPKVTAPVSDGGLGFSFKWNMGWMHDTLAWFREDPLHRGHHLNKLTFSMMYEHSERFVNALSHDEVVHGKGSLAGKMPGDDWQRHANLRLLYAYMFTRPGKTLLFMGAELGSPREWDHEGELDWAAAAGPLGAGLGRFLGVLSRTVRDRSCFWNRDHEPDGFRWIDCEDRDHSVLSWLRRDGDRHAVIVLNGTPVPRPDYRVGVPQGGGYRLLLNSDDAAFGGSGVSVPTHLTAEDRPAHGFARSLSLTLPPLGVLILAPDADDRALRELSESVGILPEFRDVEGRTVRAWNRTRRLLLGAMGLPAQTEADCVDSLEELRARDRLRLSEPVRVIGREGSGLLPVRVPEDAGGEWEWEVELELENGDRLLAQGKAAADRLKPLQQLVLPTRPEPGHHRVRLRIDSSLGAFEEVQEMVVTEDRCVDLRERMTAAGVDRERAVGLCVNLYSVRSRRNWGIGDLSDLAELLAAAAARDLDFVGLNPLHIQRNREPHISPYGPVSRLYRNPIYLDVEAVPEFVDSDEALEILRAPDTAAELERLRASERVDYGGVWALKERVLRSLHRRFIDEHRLPDEAMAPLPRGKLSDEDEAKLLRAARRKRERLRRKGSDRGRAYAEYRDEQDPVLTRFATYCAIAAILERKGGAGSDPWNWYEWPQDLQDPEHEAVARFAAEHPDEVDFFRWLQFEIDRQLAAAAGSGTGAGIGIYQDLAVGSAGDGFDTWAFRDLFAVGPTLGCPPDPLGPQGQNWALPPLIPDRLRRSGYRYWGLLLRNAFAHSGALRIDHTLGLIRQFWIPSHEPAAEGAYVLQNADELMAVIAAWSRRSGAVVVGEDLGTTPEGMSEAMERWGLLSTRVLLFERDRRGAFKAPHDLSDRALLTVVTHDTPTLLGWWRGRDLRVYRDTGIIETDGALRAAELGRSAERAALLRALVDEGLLEPGLEPDAPALIDAVHRYLVRGPSPLVGLWLDDLAAEVEPVNVPGLRQEEYPSWTRRISRPLDELIRSPLFRNPLY